MTFSAVFGQSSAPIIRKWWLPSGMPSANCVAAFQPKGAADYAASKINLANPGTYNAVDGDTYPTWDADTGWTYADAKKLTLNGSGAVHLEGDFTFIYRIIPSALTDKLFFAKYNGSSASEAGYHFHFGNIPSLDRPWVVDGTGATGSLTLNKRNIAAVTVGGTTVTYYIEGIADGGETSFTAGTYVNVPITLLNFTTGNAGSMAACAIYTVCATADQISDITLAMNEL